MKSGESWTKLKIENPALAIDLLEQCLEKRKDLRIPKSAYDWEKIKALIDPEQVALLEAINLIVAAIHT
jgi:hypothetical protein